MSSNRKEQESENRGNYVSNLIQGYWPLVLAVITVVVMWTTIQNETTANAQNIDQLTSEYTQIYQSENATSVQLASIQTDISWIKNRLSITN